MRTLALSLVALTLTSCSSEAPPDRPKRTTQAALATTQPSRRTQTTTDDREAERLRAELEKAKEELRKREQRAAQLKKDQEEPRRLKEEERRILEAAGKFGSLTEGEKLGAVQAAEKFKEKGLDSLTQDELILLLRAGANLERLKAQDEKNRKEREKR